MATEFGLADQMNNIVICQDYPDNYNAFKDISSKKAELYKRKKEIEDNILELMASSQCELLDNVKLIEELEKSQNQQTSIKSMELKSKGIVNE